MKNILTSVIVMITISAFVPGVQSQNWQNVCSPGTTFFADTTNLMGAFRLDSVQTTLPDQTIYYSYHTILDSTYFWTCLDTSNGSCLGIKVVLTSSGYYYFFNKYGDTIFINSLATTGNSWKFSNLADNFYIAATVSGIATETVLGQTDQVKTISLQAKNTGGGNINHPVNQFVVKLSQHYGLVNFFNIYDFPHGVIPVTLKGRSENQMGLQDFTWRDVYNFEIGDEFHYSGYTNGILGSTDWKTITQVIGKTLWTDSVQYIFRNCKRTNRVSISTVDTIVETYNFLTMDPSDYFMALPYELRRNSYGEADGYASYCERFNGRQVKIINPGYAYFDGTCWNSFTDIAGEKDYSPGLGITKDARYEMANNYYNILVYFSKGAETWGTPVAESCEVLVGVDELNNDQISKISVFPNPASDKITINIPYNLFFTFFDIAGRIVLTVQLHQSVNEINISDLPEGIYFWKAGNGSGKILIRR